MAFKGLLVSVASWLVQLEVLFITIRILLSWFRPRRYNRWFWQAEEILFRLTEPVLGPIRSRLPTTGFGMDFSPIIAIFGLTLLLRVFISLVYRI